MQQSDTNTSQAKSQGKLQGKIVFISGDDLDLGRSVAILFAREGADIIINYKPQAQKEAVDTLRYIRAEGRRCFIVPGNLQDVAASKVLIEKALKPFGKIDIMIVNRMQGTTPTFPQREAGVGS